jgi:uncharacterized protein (DUF433 family)
MWEPCASSKILAIVVYNPLAMTVLNTTQDIPLTEWDDGTIRIKGSRLKLEYILHQFKAGATAEQIQDSYPSATLRDVYGAIFYYLQNREAIDEYLRQREEADKEGIRFIDEHFDTKELRDRILARRSQLVKT